MKNNIRQQKSLLALVVVKGCVANEHFYSATWVWLASFKNPSLLKIYHLRKSK